MKCVLIAASMLTLCAAGRSQNCPDSKLTVQVRVSWICPHIEKYNNQLSCATYLGDPSDPQGTKAAQSALVNANSYLPVCLKLMGTVSTVMDSHTSHLLARLAMRSRSRPTRGERVWITRTSGGRPSISSNRACVRFRRASWGWYGSQEGLR